MKKFLSVNVQVLSFRGTTDLQAIADLNPSLRFSYSNFSAPLVAFFACPVQLHTIRWHCSTSESSGALRGQVTGLGQWTVLMRVLRYQQIGRLTIFSCSLETKCHLWVYRAPDQIRWTQRANHWNYENSNSRGGLKSAVGKISDVYLLCL
jgi:hypothetical protein